MCCGDNKVWGGRTDESCCCLIGLLHTYFARLEDPSADPEEVLLKVYEMIQKPGFIEVPPKVLHPVEEGAAKPTKKKPRP